MRPHNDKDEVAKASKKGNLKRTHPAKEEKKVDPGGGKKQRLEARTDASLRCWKFGLFVISRLLRCRIEGSFRRLKTGVDFEATKK